MLNYVEPERTEPPTEDEMDTYYTWSIGKPLHFNHFVQTCTSNLKASLVFLYTSDSNISSHFWHESHDMPGVSVISRFENWLF